MPRVSTPARDESPVTGLAGRTSRTLVVLGDRGWQLLLPTGSTLVNP